MKRIYVGLLAVCLLVMCGCSGGSQQSLMYVVDGAYNLTPQEYIDLSNQLLEEQADGNYLTIPNWDTAAANTVYVTLSFDIGFKVNDEGKITRISYHWKNTTEAANTAAFLVGATIGMISAKNGDKITEQLDMYNFNKKSIENTCEMDGSSFYYVSANYGEHNWFSVDIIE